MNKFNTKRVFSVMLLVIFTISVAGSLSLLNIPSLNPQTEAIENENADNFADNPHVIDLTNPSTTDWVWNSEHKSEQPSQTPQAALEPADHDWAVTHQFSEEPTAEFDGGFDDSHIDPWTPSYTFGSDSSGMGIIQCINGMAIMRGQTTQVGDYIPELPEDMSITSPNLVSSLPEDSRFGAGELHVRFTPHNIKTVVQFTTIPIGGVPVPIPTMVYVSTFYIYLSLEEGTLMDSLYTYTKSQYESEELVDITIPIEGFDIQDWFQISLRLFCWSDDNYVEIDFCRFDSYDLTVTEDADLVYLPENPGVVLHEGVPSNVDQNITVNIQNEKFGRNPSGDSVRVYFDPDGGVVDETCDYFSAAGDNQNPYRITMDHDSYIQGYVTYKIYFESTSGDEFWSPTYDFYTYDNEDPWVDALSYSNGTNSYEDPLVITTNIHDSGGSHIDTAYIVWDLDSDPDVWNIKDNPTGGSSSYQEMDILPPSQFLDDCPAQFTLASENLFVNREIHFRVVVFDRAGNWDFGNIYYYTPIDNIAPDIEMYDESIWWDSTSSHYVVDLGYPVHIVWQVTEPTQASGIVTDGNHLYVGVKNGTTPPTNQNDYDYRFNPSSNTQDEFSPAVTKNTRLYTFHWDYPHSSTESFQLFIYAEDNEGNIGFETYDCYVIDNRAPDVFEGENNTLAPNFDEDFMISFDAWEPSGANGVDASSLMFRYRINEGSWEDVTSSPDSSSNGNGYVNRSWIISESLFNWGDVVEYEYSVTDNGVPTANEAYINRVFDVADRYAPILNAELAYNGQTNNWSTVYTYWDASIAISVYDQEADGGSGLDQVMLNIKNRSSSEEINFAEAATWSSFAPSSHLGDNYYFIIPEENVTIEGIAVAIRVSDQEGNWVQYNKLVDVYDASRPIVLDYNLQTVENDNGNLYVGRDSILLYFKLNIPAYLRFSIDNVPQGESVSANNITQTASLGVDGIHTVNVYFNDYSWQKTLIVDTVAPGSVVDIVARQKGTSHQIMWNRPAGLDEDEPIEYNIYRGTTEDFDCNENSFIASTTEISYIYPFDETGTFYYRIVTVDGALNPSSPSNPSNSVISLNSGDVGGTVGVVIAIGAVVGLSYYGVKKYRAFYGLDTNVGPKDKTAGLKERLNFKKKNDFSEVKTTAVKETPPPKPKDDLKKEILSDDSVEDVDGWESDETGWD